MTEQGRVKNETPRKPRAKPAAGTAKKQEKQTSPDVTPNLQVVEQVEGTPLSDVESALNGFPQEDVGAKAFVVKQWSKLMGKVSGDAADTQKATNDTVKTTVQEMGKVAETLKTDEAKLAAMDKMAEAGKESTKQNENNNNAWVHIVSGIQTVAVVFVVGAIAYYSKKDEA